MRKKCVKCKKIFKEGGFCPFCSERLIDYIPPQENEETITGEEVSHDEINSATESETIKSGNNVFIKRHFQKIGPALIVILLICVVISSYLIVKHYQTMQDNAATSAQVNWVLNGNKSKAFTENDI